MYVTRPLSMYRNSPSATPEPEGPNTGVLVIQDEDSESTWAFGLLKRKSVKLPPFPQNKIMELRYSTNLGENRHTDYFYALIIPVLNRPLSSNQYYIIKSRGRSKGLAYTSSKEDEMSGCCCFGISDTPPQVFDPKNAYQQFQISNYIHWGRPHGFVSKSMAPDGVPPYFLTHKGWRAYTKTLKNLEEPTLEALGLDAALRARLPDLNFSAASAKSSDPVVVGKWYCPFIFIREGGEVDAQMSHSPYYEMTLQQSWEQIFECCNDDDGDRLGLGHVEVDVCVERQRVVLGGGRAENEEVRRVVGDGVMWFGGPLMEVGLSMAIVERVKWEQERGGFQWGEIDEERADHERVIKREEFGGVGVWKRFGCYVLVERFVLKRMDGSLVLTWEFRHTHQIRIKWE